MPLPRLFADLPAAFEGQLDVEAPWDLLGPPLAEVLAQLPSERLEIGLSPDVHLAGDRIVIGAGTRIAPTVVIEGPVFIGSGVTLRPGAYVRGGSWIGDGALVGAHSEIKHSILLPGAKVPHLSYVGDSILGADVNLGAGTVLSNFRNDGASVRIEIDGTATTTGLRKLGAILGDGVRTGCNCVLAPGCIVGAATHVYPGAQLQAEAYPADHILKVRQTHEVVPRREDRESTE